MDEKAIRLRCLELAIERANRENPTDFLGTVANYQTWFYNRIINEVERGANVPVQPQRKGQAKTKEKDILS